MSKAQREEFMNSSIVYPMFTLFVFTHLVMIYMFVTRVRAVKNGEVSAKYFKTYDVGEVPRYIKQASRHYTNLMEVPVLFYIACAILCFKGEASDFQLALAWAFVALRILHGIVHMGSNKILPRVLFFALSLMANFALWREALFN